MSIFIRRLVLSAHITFAVGWLGAVAAFLVLAVAGANATDRQTAASAYLAMAAIARFVIVPLSYAPLVTGPILSLGTPWGLFRHYWIVVKLAITALCTLIMAIHIQPIDQLAQAAAGGAILDPELDPLKLEMVVASSAALFALLLATILGVYKPRGMTAYGWRKQYLQEAGSHGGEPPDGPTRADDAPTV
jgi:hypothetical protein